jgi:predicted transcriptional regulator
MELTETNFAEETEIQEGLELKLESTNERSLIIDSDEKVDLIMKALSSITRRKILHYIQACEEGLDVSNIAAQLNMTEANISAQIKKLKEAGLIECDYCSGQHGVRKISKLKYNNIIINF